MQLQKQSVKHKNPYCFVVALGALQLLGTDKTSPCSGSIRRGALRLRSPFLLLPKPCCQLCFCSRKKKY